MKTFSGRHVGDSKPPKLYPHFLLANSIERHGTRDFQLSTITGACSVFNIIYSNKIYSIEATNMDVGINASWCEEENFLA